MLWGKFIAFTVCIRKEEKSKVNPLSFTLGNQKEKKLNLKYGEKMIISRTEINEIENGKSIEKINENQKFAL